MTKNEYLSKLANKLKVLPENERRDALEYYDGYLSDADDELVAIAQLGSPGEVAATILADHVEKGYGNATTKKCGASSLKSVGIIVAALLALPVGFPLAITAVAVLLTLFIALGSVVFAVGLSGIIFFVAGITSLMFAPFAFMHDLGFGLVVGGLGLLCLGCGILFSKLALMLLHGFGSIARIISRKILRRRSKDGRIQAIQ